MNNPTEALDAVEQALHALSLSCDTDTIECTRCGYSEDLKGTYMHDCSLSALTHLATLKQQVAELVAFREAYQWRPIADEYKDGRPCLLTNDNWAGYAVAVGQYKPSDEEFIDAGLHLQHVYPPNLCMPLPTPPAADGGQVNG